MFPKIDNISDDFVCKRTFATVDNQTGKFFGPVSKLTGLPWGEGVFVADDGWVHCGGVQGVKCSDFRRVSINI